MSTRSNEAHNGAVNLLIWESLKHAAARNLTFDMDMLHVVNQAVPNLLLLTGFGGRLAPRYQVQRSSRAVRLAKELMGVAWASRMRSAVRLRLCLITNILYL